MKHDGLIQSDQAEKLYSYPTLSGDSDTFLNGAGAFDHPHVEYGATAPPFEFSNYTQGLGQYTNWGLIYTDKYGHVIKQTTGRYRYAKPSTATDDAAGLMSAHDKALLDSIASYLADRQANEG